MSNLIINEPPLMVLPSLAKEIGLNEAIILQQIHYWIDGNKKRKSQHHFIDGKWWTYNTVAEWAEQFPFWSESTVKRTLAKLREMGLVLAEQHGGDWDKTLWYSICYTRLGQLDPMEEVIADSTEEVNLTHSTYYTETNNTETNTKNNTDNGGGGVSPLPNAVIIYQNEIGMLSKIISDQLLDSVDEFGDQLVIDAIKVAANNNVRKWTYVDGILKRWRANGKTNGQPSKTKEISGSFYG